MTVGCPAPAARDKDHRMMTTPELRLLRGRDATRVGRTGLLRLATAVGVAATGVLVGTPVLVNAAVIETFTKAYDNWLFGDYLLVGNTQMQCITTTTSDRWDADNDGNRTEALAPLVDFASPASLITDCLADQATDNISSLTSNDYRWMVFNDVDGDSTTFNSSSITVTIPSGATVQYAQLLWHGNALGSIDSANVIDDADYDLMDPTGAPLGSWPSCNSTNLDNDWTFYGEGGGPEFDSSTQGGIVTNRMRDAANAAAQGPRNQMKIKVGSGTYQTVTSSDEDITLASSTGRLYQQEAVVTSLFSGVPTGSPLTITGANISTGQGHNCTGGWALVLVVATPSASAAFPVPRRIQIYDGFAVVANGESASTSLAGFLASGPGTVEPRVGVVGWEGDQQIAGDRLTFEGSTLSEPRITSGRTTNYWSSTIGDFTGNPTYNTYTRNPNWADNAGPDIKTDNVPLSLLAASGDGLSVSFSTTGDQYLPGAFIFSAVMSHLQGTVYEDLDHDGIQDAGEAGIPGVTLTLTNGTTTYTTTTDAEGNYIFLGSNDGNGVPTGLPAGTYTLTETQPSGWSDGIDTVGTAGGSDGTNSANDVITTIQHDLTMPSTEYNFGEHRVSIGDTVWNDTNRNGVQNTGEAGISGVTVNLYAAKGTTLVGSTATNGSGFYSFSGLSAGATYVLEFVTPSGYRFTGQDLGGNDGTDSDPNTSTGRVTITAPSSGIGSATSPDNPTFDAGMVQVDLALSKSIVTTGPYYPGQTITYTLTPSNVGTTNALAGWSVTEVLPTGMSLVSMSGTGYTCVSNTCTATGTLGPGNGNPITATATVASTSNTSLRNVAYVSPAAGEVTEVNVLGTPPTAGTDTAATSTNNDAHVDLNSGPSSLGDRVWVDVNSNGVQDGGEVGLTGVTVHLYQSDGTTLITSTTTDYTGNYSFTGLAPATYVVTFVQPTGYLLSPTGAGTASTDSNGLSTTVTLAAGATDSSIDLGVYEFASLGDFVWDDLDADGVQDAGEPGVPGVTVTLLGSDGTTVVATTTTDANGGYEFTDLVPGTYTVTFTQPAGTQLSPTGAGTPSTDSNGLTTTVTLTSGQTDTSIDLGVYRTVSLGDFVWDDPDADGVQGAGEPGVPGVTVTLYGADPTTAVATTTTNDVGFYEFAGLVPGTYTVTFTQPAGYELSPTGTGTPSTDSNGLSTAVTVQSGETDFTIDLGVYQTATIGDVVWVDYDADGVQDAGEPGLPGVIVTLDPGTPGDPSDDETTTTDGNGGYTFTGLVPGDYTTTFTVPAGYTASPSNQGVDTGLDSNGAASSTTLVSGETDLSVDLGLIGAAGITVVKEICDPSVADPCDPLAAIGAGGWTETLAVDFLGDVTWRITVTNSGLQTLTDVVVSDPLVASCAMNPLVASMLPGASQSYICTTSEVLVGFTNTATAKGDDPNGNEVTDDDPATVTTPAPVYGLVVEKSVVNAFGEWTADTAPGIYVTVGEPVSWVYDVSLGASANVPVSGVTVTDDGGPLAGFTAEYVSGDTDNDDLLDPSETWRFESPASLTVTAGQYTNTATATGTPISPAGEDPLTATDPANHFGIDPGVDVVKTTNGLDANTTYGAFIATGAGVAWSYEVSNTGNVPLADVTVVDDQGVVVSCGLADGDDDGDIDLLAVGGTVTCTGTGTAIVGQYANTVTVTGQPADDQGNPIATTDDTPLPTVTADDPSHYFGVNPSVELVKTTQTLDNDTITGPFVTVGDAVLWTYEVTNTGNTALLAVTVTDDRVAASAIDCGDGSNAVALLLPGATVTCTATATATAGQYANTGSVSGQLAFPTTVPSDPSDPDTWPTDPAAYTPVTLTNGSEPMAPVTDTNPDHYFGVVSAVSVVKSTNTVDADAPFGPLVHVGGPVEWTYEVTNDGTVALEDVTLVDDQILASAIDCGDGSNVIALLLPGATVTCTATGTATAGQYANIADVTGTPVFPDPTVVDDPGFDPDDPSTWPTDPAAYQPVTVTDTTGSGTDLPAATATDPSHYYGATTGVTLVKFTNGQDANSEPGPYIVVGSTVTWTFQVANTGTTALVSVTVTDDKVNASAIDCGTGTNTIPVLLPGLTVTCTATGTATEGQYGNIGAVTGDPAMPDPSTPGIDPADPSTWPTTPGAYTPAVTTDPAGNTTPLTPVTDDNPSHYFGADPSIQIQKQVCVLADQALCSPADNAHWADFTVITQGTLGTFRITVTNTGNVTLAPVQLTDPLVADCAATFTTLTPGQVEVVTCTIDPVPGSLRNTATATGQPVDGEGDPIIDPATDEPVPPVTDDDVADLQLPPDLVMAKTSNKTTVIVGAIVDYTITAVNQGLGPAASVVAVDTLPVGMEPVGLPPNMSYDPTTRHLTWIVGDLAAGAAKSITYSVVIEDVTGALVNVVVASSETPGDPPDNNDAETPVQVTRPTVPQTGGDSGRLLWLGGGLLGAGISAVLIGRRRRQALEGRPSR